MRSMALALALVTTVAAPPALAQWKALDKQTNTSDYLLAVDIVSDLQFVTGGMRIDQSSGFPLPSTVFYTTKDGGQLFQQIQIGSAGGLGGAGVADVAFDSLLDGWAVLGGDVWRTTTGTAFKKATVTSSGSVTAIARLDANTGVAVGSAGGAWRTTDGAATWTPVQTGTTADLGCVRFIDARRGWAAGEVPVTIPGEAGAQDTLSYDENVVLGTTDGGASWTILSRFPKDDAANGTGGLQSCPLFFLPDGKTGWLVQTQFDADKQRASNLALLRTGDGGRTWRDLKVDVQVGTLNFMMKVPIKMSYAIGMYWTDDGKHGRVSGAADTGLSSDSGGGGGAQPIYKLVDLTTADGGVTWQKPDYGEMTMDLTGGQAPAGDPRPMKATIKSWYQGVMVGEKGTVWALGADCKMTSECLEGYECKKPDPKVYAKCYPKGATFSDGVLDRDAVGGSDVSGGEGVSPYLDIPVCEGDDCPKSKGGGCAGGTIPAGPGAWPAAMLMVMLLAATRRRRL